ncbi:MAG: pyruvate kinase [Bacteroidota bacterium]
MKRQTKIVCTIGPASSDRATLRRLVEAGMNVARLNFSHGSHDDHKRVIGHLRAISDEIGRPVPILQDLQGPKIRVGPIKDGSVLIHKGQRLVLTADPIELGDRHRVSISYDTLAEDVQVGGHILMDDGALELEVVGVEGRDVVTEVVVGGSLRSRKGVNLPHLATSTPSLTEKDLEDLRFGLSMDVDIIALSFVRQQSDVVDLCRRVRDSGKEVKIVAKIEKPEAVDNIDAIIAETDAIMVARGDLGIEMRMSLVPRAQKTIINKCRAASTPVITATQMLESMIENPRPTRAEASDVANAVLDGTDAVMLSGETAMGKDPVRVVEVMARIIEETEDYQRTYGARMIPDDAEEALPSEAITRSVSYTACELAEQVGAKAIACLTATGSTARSIARHRPSMSVFAFTDNPRIVAQMGLLWGTETFAIPFQKDTDAGVAAVHRLLTEKGHVEPGDLIVITAGMPLPKKGRTNMIHVSRI